MAIKKIETIAPFLQSSFLIIVISTWAVELGFQVLQAVRVYAFNSNLSSFYTVFLYSGIIPLLLFVIATFMNRRYALSRRVVFENVLIALVGTMFCDFVGLVVRMVTSRIVVIDGTLEWWWFEVGAATAGFIICVAVLLVARRTTRWV